MPYPPGTTTSDLKRAGIIETRPECPDCGSHIGEIGDHERDCPMGDLGREELGEWLHERANSYDRYEL